MDVGLEQWGLRRIPGAFLSNVPVVVGAFALTCWLFASNGIYVDGDWGSGVVLNPLNYILSMVLHFHWEHFASNMRWWIPIGIVFTILTSNRHVLLVAVVSHVLTQVVSSGLFRFVSGLSVVVFAVLTATLVRSIGYAFQNHSMEALQNAIAALLIPVLTGVFLIVIVAGPSWVGHFEHFLGALFGAAIETIYVFDAHDENTAETPARPFR
jgi:membrane associated rhomboid family serine protease